MPHKNPPIVPDMYIREVERLVASKASPIDHIVGLWAASLLLRSPSFRDKKRIDLRTTLVQGVRDFLSSIDPKTGEVPYLLKNAPFGLGKVPLLNLLIRDKSVVDPRFVAALYLLDTIRNLHIDSGKRFLRDEPGLKELAEIAVRNLLSKMDTSDTQGFGMVRAEEQGQHACGWLLPSPDGWGSRESLAASAKTGKEGKAGYSLFHNLLALQALELFGNGQRNSLRDGIYNGISKNPHQPIFSDEKSAASYGYLIFAMPNLEETTYWQIATVKLESLTGEAPKDDILRGFFTIQAMIKLEWSDASKFERDLRTSVIVDVPKIQILYGGVEDQGLLNNIGAILFADAVNNRQPVLAPVPV